ncbi:MAG: S66 peptidase family protein [Thermoanaerobaculia bacterium]
MAALSGRVDGEKLDRGISYLRSRGYGVVEADNIRRVDGDFAGSDLERAEGYRALLRDPDVEAILFARGGWGAARTLGHLDPGEISKNPKIHLGGSDLASFFAFLRRRTGLICFHGPMVAVDFASRPPDAETAGSWEALLAGETPEFSIGSEDVVRPGSGAGPLVGGCLSILASLEGTPDALDTRGTILFWEDVNEEIYRLDRMLTQLRLAGRLDGLAGVIIGTLEEIHRHGKRDEAGVASLLSDHFGSAGFPVVRNWPSGHGLRNRTLPLGARVRVDADRGLVRFEEPGVA